jgi:hypothetical protein
VKRALVLVAACGGAPRSIELVDHTRDRAIDALAAASGDVAKMEQLFGDELVNAGVWFVDPRCALEFPGSDSVSRDKRRRFAECLVGLHLEPSPRHDALGDVVVLTYAPGFELEARVTDERLTWIGFESLEDDKLPTVSATTLETLRTGGDRNGPIDPTIAASLELSGSSHVAYTWMKVCIDGSGAVSDVHVHETTSPQASAAFSEAARKWTFKPFVVEDAARPVCADVRTCFPASHAPPIEVVPMVPPHKSGGREPIVLTQQSAQTQLHRLEGTNVMITPDDETKVEIQRHQTSVAARFRICMAPSGRVDSIFTLYATGYPQYDRKLRNELQHWRYSPYVVDGEAVPVCTAVTFIYSQR